MNAVEVTLSTRRRRRTAMERSAPIAEWSRDDDDDDDDDAVHGDRAATLRPAAEGPGS